MRRSTRPVTVLLCVVVALLFTAPARADEVADFYKGRTFTVVAGHEPGTGYDIYARALARHIGRHIPGEPAVVVQNMVGASGILAANWLYNVAPKDGTVIATFVPTVAFEPLFGNGGAKFDSVKFTWIGNMDEGVGVCGVSRASGVQKFEDLYQKDTAFGGTGATGPLGRYALAVKNLFDIKRMKVVFGYKGSSSVKLAMERGEVNGICGVSLSTLNSQWRADLDSGEFKPILQLSGRPSPELKGVPHVDNYAKTDDDRAVFGLVFGSETISRPFAAPPDIPAARRDALRKAFLDTVADPQFLADAEKLKIDITPMSGQEVADFLARVTNSSPAVIARARAAYKNE